MFHKVKTISPLDDFRLCVIFESGITKIYDAKPLEHRLPFFKKLLSDPEIFSGVYVDVGGYGIVWDDDYDLSCDELWENGVTIDN